MDRAKLLKYARVQFGSEPEYLWEKYPAYWVLSNRKWYAAVMDVPGNKLGLPGNAPLQELLGLPLLERDDF